MLRIIIKVNIKFKKRGLASC